MKKYATLIFVFLLIILSFMLGKWFNTGGQQGAGRGKKILYYVDPMHPSYKSDKPGRAPDCGMELEPVYADGSTGGAAKDLAGQPPGTVQVAPGRQQLIGVKTAVVEQAGGSHTLRLLGRVVPDERRTYVINATIDGWITDTRPNTTGSLVRKNETLATFYSPEFLSAVQALLFALSSMDRVQSQPAAVNPAQQGQMEQFGINLTQYRNSLRNLGMGDPQIEKMIKTRQFMENVDIIAPGDGFILTRNVSPGQRFEKGKELYRIANLDKVWVLMDTYGTEAEQLKPGTALKVTMHNSSRTYNARVSAILPQFDPVSRTLKVRLELDNPGFHLRPDMFVNVELPVSLAKGVIVPSEALLDSGLKKTVFIDRGNGIFEPRPVETGRTIGSQVEVVRGLQPGERIAVSGTFLLDSESRMRTAAAGISGPASLDPVCGMYVDEAKARAAGLTAGYLGVTYYFCVKEDLEKFRRDPARYTAAEKKAGGEGDSVSHEQHEAKHKPAATPKSPAKGKPPVASHEKMGDEGPIKEWMKMPAAYDAKKVMDTPTASPVKGMGGKEQ